MLCWKKIRLCQRARLECSRYSNDLNFYRWSTRLYTRSNHRNDKKNHGNKRNEENKYLPYRPIALILMGPYSKQQQIKQRYKQSKATKPNQTKPKEMRRIRKGNSNFSFSIFQMRSIYLFRFSFSSRFSWTDSESLLFLTVFLRFFFSTDIMLQCLSALGYEPFPISYSFFNHYYQWSHPLVLGIYLFLICSPKQ